MAEDGCDGSADGDLIGLRKAVGCGDVLRDEDGDESLEGVEDEREDAETLGA